MRKVRPSHLSSSCVAAQNPILGGVREWILPLLHPNWRTAIVMQQSGCSHYILVTSPGSITAALSNTFWLEQLKLKEIESSSCRAISSLHHTHGPRRGVDAAAEEPGLFLKWWSLSSFLDSHLGKGRREAWVGCEKQGKAHPDAVKRNHLGGKRLLRLPISRSYYGVPSHLSPSSYQCLLYRNKNKVLTCFLCSLIMLVRKIYCFLKSHGGRSDALEKHQLPCFEIKNRRECSGKRTAIADLISS